MCDFKPAEMDEYTREYRGNTVAVFSVDGVQLLYLAQLFFLFLKGHFDLSLHMVAVKLKRFNITTMPCNPTQIEILQKLNALYVGEDTGSEQKLISKSEFDLFYNHYFPLVKYRDEFCCPAATKMTVLTFVVPNDIYKRLSKKYKNRQSNGHSFEVPCKGTDTVCVITSSNVSAGSNTLAIEQHLTESNLLETSVIMSFTNYSKVQKGSIIPISMIHVNDVQQKLTDFNPAKFEDISASIEGSIIFRENQNEVYLESGFVGPVLEMMSDRLYCPVILAVIDSRASYRKIEKFFQTIVETEDLSEVIPKFYEQPKTQKKSSHLEENYPNSFLELTPPPSTSKQETPSRHEIVPTESVKRSLDLSDEDSQRSAIERETKDITNGTDGLSAGRLKKRKTGLTEVCNSKNLSQEREYGPLHSKLIDNHVTLVSQMDPGFYSSRLLQDRVITMDEKEELETLRTRRLRADYLITLMLRKDEKFIASLALAMEENGDEHLAKLLR